MSILNAKPFVGRSLITILCVTGLSGLADVSGQTRELPERTPAAELNDRTIRRVPDEYGGPGTNPAPPAAFGVPQVQPAPGNRTPNAFPSQPQMRPLPVPGSRYFQSAPMAPTQPNRPSQDMLFNQNIAPPQNGMPLQSNPLNPNSPFQSNGARVNSWAPVDYHSSAARRVSQASLIYISELEPRIIQKNDLVTIIVKESSEVTLDSRFSRNRRSSLTAAINEFIRLSDRGTLVGAAENSPTIDGDTAARVDTSGRVQERETIVYRITATVVDVLPNGNLVLQARKSASLNDDIWEHTLNGIVRSVDIAADNTVLSENIANLQVHKEQRGRIDSSTKRFWGTKLLDKVFPF